MKIWHKLQYANWEEVVRESSNTSRTWTEARDQALSMIRRLEILALSLPENRQVEIFNVIELQTLIQALFMDRYEALNFKKKKWPTDQDDEVKVAEHIYELDIRKLLIAKLMISMALEYLKKQYSVVEEPGPIRDRIIAQLDDLKSLADAVARKAEYKYHVPSRKASEKLERKHPEYFQDP